MQEKLKIPKFGNNDYMKESLDARCQWLENATNVKIEHMRKYSIDPESMKGNIENPIGVLQVPLGITGPLIVNGDFAKGEFLFQWQQQRGLLF
jgi:hydroxymethylglutaryl-CoA reductase (NADPH)